VILGALFPFRALGWRPWFWVYTFSVYFTYCVYFGGEMENTKSFSFSLLLHYYYGYRLQYMNTEEVSAGGLVHRNKLPK
jgi:hypothetical protein